MQPSHSTRAARLFLAAATALGLCAGGVRAESGGLLDGFSNFNWNNFFHKDEQAAPGAPVAEAPAGSAPGSPGHHLFCPEIIVLDGTAAARVYAGAPATNMNLRYQYALGDVVRECAVNGDQLALRVGVAGNVLLGPAGAPASFSVPVRVAVISTKGSAPVVSKLYRVAATIPSGQAQTDFALVTEPLLVPFIQDHAEDDYTIKVGIDEGPEKPAPKRKP